MSYMLSQADREHLKAENLGNGLKDHNGLSWLVSYQITQSGVDPVVSAEEKVILRKLAQKVAQLAELPVQEERKQRWLDHHDLKITEPLVFIDPEYAWYELMPHTVLQCKNNLARLWEYRLRKEIYWQEVIRDDRVLTKVFPVCHVFSTTSRGIEAKHTDSDLAEGAYHIDAVLKDWDDIGKLKYQQIIVDNDKSEKIFALAHDVFDGILEVRVQNSWWYSDGINDEVVNLRGFENILYDYYEHPKEVHALMGFLRDERLQMLDFLEKEHLLTLNNGQEFVGTGGYGWCRDLPGSDFDPMNIGTKNMWGYAESQASVSISPQMFDEFVLDYQVPILDRFGINFYGCCEILDQRLHYIKKKVKNLRKVSVSPWCNIEYMADQMRGDYVFCWKQNPALIAVKDPDWELVRREIRNAFEIVARYDCPAEVLMRDVRTLAYRSENAVNWVKIAREEAKRIYG